jgi:LysR family carnitine catabolism transcriptional activator
MPATPKNTARPPARSPNLSTRQLRAFLALAELSSFTRAAAACHLSQPAFSVLIQTQRAADSRRTLV